jgi:glucose-6-phosphate isomerase
MVELAETSLISPGEDFSSVFDDVLTQTKQHKLVARLWQKDTTLWSSDAGTQDKIAHRLGWLDSLERVAGRLGDVQAWVNTVRDAGYRDVLLLGMGGSSLCPLVLAEVFVEDTQGLNVHVLDTTDALTIERMTQDLDWWRSPIHKHHWWLWPSVMVLPNV